MSAPRRSTVLTADVTAPYKLIDRTSNNIYKKIRSIIAALKIARYSAKSQLSTAKRGRYSIFIHIAPGLHDNQLVWPFHVEVEGTLIRIAK